MFFHKPVAVVYIQRNSLEVYTKDTPSPVVVQVPEEVLHNFEIRNTAQFSSLITTALQSITEAHDTVLLLSSDSTYDKLLSQSSAAEAQEVQQFLSEIPFDPDKVSHIIQRNAGVNHIYATNKDVYVAVANALKQKGWDTIAVSPAAAIGISGNSINYSAVLNDIESVKNVQFGH